MRPSPKAGSKTPQQTVIVDHAIGDVRRFCKEHANAAQVKKYARFFTEGYDAYGIDKDTWAAHEGMIFERYHDALGLEGILALGDKLFESGKYEEGSFAIVTARPLIDTFDKAAVEHVGEWLETGVRNWAHTDVICGQLIGPCLLRGVVTPPDIARWTRSPSRWKRRAVPVSLLALLPDKASIAKMLSWIRPLMTDAERVVHQGTGWFLREAWKAEPATVEAFLLEWKDTAPRLIFQYATEKMTPAGKARFRRAKKG